MKFWLQKSINGCEVANLTLSLEQGMDIKTVSHMLGHTDAGFTMNTYMHVTDSMQENVANTMGNLLGGNAANS